MLKRVKLGFMLLTMHLVPMISPGRCWWSRLGAAAGAGTKSSPHSEFTISETKALVFSGKCPVYQDPEWRGKLLSPREDVHSLNTLQAVGH